MSFGDVKSAEQLFASIKKNHVISYGAMMKGYNLNNNPIKCLKLFEKIPGRRLRPLDPAGSCKKEAGTSPDPAGKPRKSPEVEAVFRPEIYWIFSGGFL
jgi:pentatricopeptide repeat protein